MIKYTIKSNFLLKFIIIYFSLFLNLAYAQTVPIFRANNITINPYVTDQLDIGGFVDASPNHPKTGVRGSRIRNGVRINIRKQVELGGIWDFGPAPNGQMRLFEGQVSYIGLHGFIVTAGIFKPSFGLESDQAQGDTMFVERSSISTITRNLAAGIARQAIQVEEFSKRYHFAMSATAGTSGPGNNSRQRAMVFRFAGLPIMKKNLLIHLGISGEWVFRPASSKIALSDIPEINPGTVSKYLNTGEISLDSIGALGVEAAISWKKWIFYGEAYDILANKHIYQTKQVAHFHGWYGQIAYTVNGNSRSWKARSGAFSSPECYNKAALFCNGMGVLEIGSRLSQVNLESESIHGGNQKTASFVMNWWPTTIFRLSFQYEYGQIKGGRNPETFQAIMSLFQIKI